VLIQTIKKIRREILAFVRLLPYRLSGLKIRTGADFYCNKGFHIESIADFTAGNNVYIGRYTHVGCNLILGSDVLIASFVSFVGGDHQIDGLGDKTIKSQGRRHDKQVILEDNVWIGHGAIILAGVTVKSGAVVAAGSVVTKDVEENQIVGGNPAKLIRMRKP